MQLCTDMSSSNLPTTTYTGVVYIYVQLNTQCLCLGIQCIRPYEVSGEPINFCCPTADGLVGAANLLTVSRNRLGRAIGICG